MIRTTQYLAMYAQLDKTNDVEDNARLVSKMQPLWDAMSPAERQQARKARSVRGEEKA